MIDNCLDNIAINVMLDVTCELHKHVNLFVLLIILTRIKMNLSLNILATYIRCYNLVYTNYWYIRMENDAIFDVTYRYRYIQSEVTHSECAYTLKMPTIIAKSLEYLNH